MKNRSGNTISCFGHAVFLNAVALLVAEDVWKADSKTCQTLAELDLGEAEGIVLTISNNVVTCLHVKA